MREVTILKKASFSKAREPCVEVALPHTWNNLDGQDGGNDYYRGKGTYEIELPKPARGKRQYVQFEGANHVADVYCNGTYVGCHEGGFSTFRFELTEHMRADKNVLKVIVDNDAPEIYPQRADFTFFGGLYRDVSFVEVERTHFALEKDGTNGVFVTPQDDGDTRADVFLEGSLEGTVKLKIKNAGGQVVASAECDLDTSQEGHVVLECKVENPRPWDGRKDPYLYFAEAVLEQGGEILDKVEAGYGYRSFHVDVEKGFFLNGKSYPLHGVSRHQDREDKGWAIGKAEHEEDMRLILEMGANTIRLAHYQHDQHFYDLCDKEGMVAWAEIPFISQFIHSKKARQNTLDQMRELIAQNYNHPSVCFWGISNEISMGGESEELYDNLRELNALAKKMDSSRPTTMAQLSLLDPENVQAHITDVQGYNIYLGWYIGEVDDNGRVLDEIHEKIPQRPLALSEYGADALTTWHGAKPENHDYTEEYQAEYHEELLKCFESRPYLWATYVWNMFDFAADARDEGGCKGRNNKGLVTYDRKLKKDAFYIYQAYWTEEPMVHLCGRRFVDRAPGERDVKVYTNGEAVTLLVNGEAVGTHTAEHHRCVFENVPLKNGENVVVARECGSGVEDRMVLNGVDVSNPGYRLADDAVIGGNWFDEETKEPLVLEYLEGCYSIKDTMGDIVKDSRTAAILQEFFMKTQNMEEDREMAQWEGTMEMVQKMSFLKVVKVTGMKCKPVELVEINRKLSQIKKEAV